MSKLKEESTLFLVIKPLISSFFPLVWMGHIGLGLMYGLMGPAQPYLAKQIGVGHQAISLLWTARAVGCSSGYALTGTTFGSSWMDSSRRRLMFLGFGLSIVTICLFAIPFINKFVLMISVFGIMTFASASFDSADNGFMNMMFGPTFSRPLVQSLHASASIGFLLVATLLSLMLPKEKEQNSQNLCEYLRNPENISKPMLMANVSSDESNLNNSTETKFEWPVLLMPCYIIGTWMFLASSGFIILGIRNLPLPNYFQKNLVAVSSSQINMKKESKQISKSIEVLKEEEKEKIQNCTKHYCNKKYEFILVFCGMLSIFLISGMDLTFQSQIYIYGLCGPLNLSPELAGWLNTLYYANYMIGRLVSIPLSTIISPTKIIFISLSGCMINAIVIVLFGNYNVIILFTTTSLMAFHVCFMFPSVVTWITSNVSNVSSKQISFVMLGSPIASSVFPSLTAKLFNEYGPVYVFYTTNVCAVLQFLNFFLMNWIAKRRFMK